MPSRNNTPSPDTHHHHRHKRYRSPGAMSDHHKRKHKRKKYDHDRDREDQGRYHSDSIGDDRHHSREHRHDQRRREIKTESRDTQHRPIKQEQEDDEYERQHIKREPRDDREFRRQHRERERNNERRRERRQNQSGNPFSNDGRSEHERYGQAEPSADAQPPKEKEKPNFELSGKLTEDTNTFRGIVIKYNEPPEARKPKRRWRLYPFKGEQQLPVLHLHRQSAYLLGRERKVADIPIDHPSCSKQHAAIQFRLVPYERDDGSTGRQVRPYVIDLNSANGTYVNNKRIEGSRYVQLFEKDVLKFGYSTREYVILHDKTDTTEIHDEGESP